MSFTMCNHPRTLTLLRRVSMTTYIIPPTVLYIKQHSITKKKYFGKTTAKNPYKYLGSGEYWTDHIKKHGKEHVVTRYVSKPYTDSDTISKRALAFSIRHNIVESKDWANLKPENGLDGGCKGTTRSTEHCRNISISKKGKPASTPAWNKGISTGPQSPELIEKRIAGRRGKPTKKKGQPAWNKGIPTGKPAWNKGIPNPKKGIPTGSIPKIECPHCGKMVGNKRYHFDNCKSKTISLEGA